MASEIWGIVQKGHSVPHSGACYSGREARESQVKPPSLRIRFVIAYWPRRICCKLDCSSPLRREGPRQSHPMPQQSVLCSPVCRARIAKNGRTCESLGKYWKKFSAVQTVWRRERDSNPRYGFPYSGFQDHPFQPLTHPSAGSAWKQSLSVSLQQAGSGLASLKTGGDHASTYFEISPALPLLCGRSPNSLE